MAGAAHELGTPLATIALVAKELEHALQRGTPIAELTRDAQLIRQEVERCREILQQMAARAGEGAGEMLAAIDLHGVEQSLSATLGAGAARVTFERVGSLTELVAPKQLLVQVLANLVRNAIEAQAGIAAREPVRVVTRVDSERAAFEILDQGTGIPAHTLNRVGEPFFTTKPARRGASGSACSWRARSPERMGGDLTLAARPGGGTVARLTVPRDMLEPRSAA